MKKERTFQNNYVNLRYPKLTEAAHYRARGGEWRNVFVVSPNDYKSPDARSCTNE